MLASTGRSPDLRLNESLRLPIPFAGTVASWIDSPRLQ